VLCVILCDVYFCLLCLIVVPLPPGKTPFGVQLNNNNMAEGFVPTDSQSRVTKEFFYQTHGTQKPE
jgi:hypothetical protein